MEGDNEHLSFKEPADQKGEALPVTEAECKGKCPIFFQDMAVCRES